MTSIPAIAEMSTRALHGILAVLVVVQLSGCWPGRCNGALRGTPMVAFAGDHAPCTEDERCAEVITAETGFHQRGDFARVEDPGTLGAASGLTAESWFLVDGDGVRVSSQIEAQQHNSAHSCASAIGFDLVPEAPLEAGVYRLVLLVDRVSWPVLRQGVDVGSWDGEPAVIQFYRVE